MADELWSERDGNILTMSGWQPAALVEAQRARAKSLYEKAWSCALAGFFVFGIVLGPIAIVLNARAVGASKQWGGADLGWNASIAGVVVTVVHLVVVYLVVSGAITF